jgi:hypothetical protein
MDQMDFMIKVLEDRVMEERSANWFFIARPRTVSTVGEGSESGDDGKDSGSEAAPVTADDIGVDYAAGGAVKWLSLILTRVRDLKANLIRCAPRSGVSFYQYRPPRLLPTVVSLFVSITPCFVRLTASDVARWFRRRTTTPNVRPRRGTDDGSARGKVFALPTPKPSTVPGGIAGHAMFSPRDTGSGANLSASLAPVPEDDKRGIKRSETARTVTSPHMCVRMRVSLSSLWKCASLVLSFTHVPFSCRATASAPNDAWSRGVRLLTSQVSGVERQQPPAAAPAAALVGVGGGHALLRCEPLRTQERRAVQVVRRARRRPPHACGRDRHRHIGVSGRCECSVGGCRLHRRPRLDGDGDTERLCVCRAGAAACPSQRERL